VLCLNLHDYPRAIGYCQQALEQWEVTPDKDIRQNPPFFSLAYVQDKQDLLKVFGNKTEDLLRLYGQTHRSEDLGACLRTALLADSIITALRHEQTDEPSKLFWRNRTREFYSNALEASWLAHDTKTAFFFMEKSRAVLLNDRLNELGASALLPAGEAARQQHLQLELVQQEQELAALSDTAPNYRNLQLGFLQAKDSLERYTLSLEQKAPAYYQYKYADDVPALDSFERFLSNDRHSFIHYFINDTVAYCLVISSMNARLLKVPYKGINERLSALLRFCSDKQALNSNYGAFAVLSNSIYRTLFQPLQIPKGRVVVCPDNFLIPFEALCPDSSGRNFLLSDYVFDYVYSARYLLKSFDNPEGKGNFLGLAPASFADYLHVPDLRQSVTSIRAAAACYSDNTCKTGQGASRRYFMEEAGSYTILNVYSHARADSGDNEPVLFMSDSVIHLSELQLLQHPSAQLVVLSACQTNAGKNASGEGIYSLARGFASAGIPAVASTMWQADEHSIYEITEQFHKGLSQGMGKDEALQKAKLFFIRSGGNEDLLPYYWANMILIGNVDPVKLSASHGHLRLIIGLAFLLFLAFGVALRLFLQNKIRKTGYSRRRRSMR
jgi:CHAT domain-containing protein